MECTTLALRPEFKHRYKVDAKIYNTQKQDFEKVTLFLDTGCYNSLIPIKIAEYSGKPLGHIREYRIGGGIIKAEAYSIKEIMLGNFAIKRVIAFAADYTGEFSSDILIGANVMNNWRMTFDRDENIFQFCEKPPKDLGNKKNIYQNYFDLAGNYIYVQDTEIDS